MRNGLNCFIHPTSTVYLLGNAPDFLIYNDLVMTSKPFIHCVTSVDPKWLLEYGSVFY